MKGSMKYLAQGLVLVALAGIGATSATAQQPREVPFDNAGPSHSNRDSNNWGWLGLAGLVGLAGMKRRESSRARTAVLP